MLPRRAPVAQLSALLLLAACKGIDPLNTNVPEQRLAQGLYTSPGGEYAVRVPWLKEPGASIEERALSPTMRGVSFSDSDGRAYTVLVSDGPGVDLEQLDKGFEVGGMWRAKGFVQTSRGRELRLVGVDRAASPVVTSAIVKGEQVDSKADLVVARSFFLHQGRLMQVTAGLTPLSGGPIEPLLGRARKMLEEFLSGLVLR